MIFSVFKHELSNCWDGRPLSKSRRGSKTN